MDKKKCFIITPIGDEGTGIRRHIDGIINAVLKPVVEDEFGYELEVSHRIDAPGNIPKQVILSIYKSDLVIANLTSNNPNVMYEIALRHCFGNPAIMIAENGTKIPADIMGERTIFYTNDATGVLELREKLESMIQRISVDSDNSSEMQGPVYDALRSEIETESIIKNLPSTEKAEEFSLIINMLEDLKMEIRSKEALEARRRAHEEQHIKIYIDTMDVPFPPVKVELEEFIGKYLNDIGVRGYGLNISRKLIRIMVPMIYADNPEIKRMLQAIREILERRGVKELKTTVRVGVVE